MLNNLCHSNVCRLTEILKQRSVEHRQHTTRIFDWDGKPAISGSLLLRGDDCCERIAKKTK